MCLCIIMYVSELCIIMYVSELCIIMYVSELCIIMYVSLATSNNGVFDRMIHVTVAIKGFGLNDVESLKKGKEELF